MLGLPDLYDTTYRSTGVGQWCVMGTGSWNDGGRTPGHLCAWAKARLGWIAPAVVTGAQVLQLQPIEQDKGGVYRLWTGGAVGSDYLLIEARQATGFDHALPGAGLLIWRIDEVQRDNTRPGAYLVELEQADGRHDLEPHAEHRCRRHDLYVGSADPLIARQPVESPRTHRQVKARGDLTLEIVHRQVAGAERVAELRVHQHAHRPPPFRCPMYLGHHGAPVAYSIGDGRN